MTFSLKSRFYYSSIQLSSITVLFCIWGINLSYFYFRSSYLFCHLKASYLYICESSFFWCTVAFKCWIAWFCGWYLTYRIGILIWAPCWWSKLLGWEFIVWGGTKLKFKFELGWFIFKCGGKIINRESGLTVWKLGFCYEWIRCC